MATAKFQAQMKVESFDGCRIESKGTRASCFRSLYLCMTAAERTQAHTDIKALDEKYPVSAEVSDE